MTRPIIGITPDEGLTGGAFPLPRLELKHAYARAVIDAGGVPLVLPCTDDPKVLAAYLAAVQGLLITGGAFDIPPALYREKPLPGLGALKPARTRFELALLRGALRRDRPVLGVCGGMQLLNVLRGGTLYQDLRAQLPQAGPHEQDIARHRPWHAVTVVPDSLLARATRARTLRVNSTHHQAVKQVGRRLRVSAVAPDGVIEAVECTDRRFAVGVQWHPELLGARARGGLYRALVAAAAE